MLVASTTDSATGIPFQLALVSTKYSKQQAWKLAFQRKPTQECNGQSVKTIKTVMAEICVPTHLAKAPGESDMYKCN
jgi:hypothetical protein